ncbi:MAG: hypothetical protein NVSMB29_14280 [Candidatus Dormibacteria bacterium]
MSALARGAPETSEATIATTAARQACRPTCAQGLQCIPSPLSEAATINPIAEWIKPVAPWASADRDHDKASSSPQERRRLSR